MKIISKKLITPDELEHETTKITEVHHTASYSVYCSKIQYLLGYT